MRGGYWQRLRIGAFNEHSAYETPRGEGAKMILDKKQMTEEDVKLQYITPAILSKWGLDRGRAAVILLEGPDGVRLRKINHIRTICGTTAIEGNTLTEDQITAILAGKRVAAPARKIAEVKGALSPCWPNPFSGIICISGL